MNIVITSGEILLVIAICASFIIGTTAGYFVGKIDGKLEK